MWGLIRSTLKRSRSKSINSRDSSRRDFYDLGETISASYRSRGRDVPQIITRELEKRKNSSEGKSKLNLSSGGLCDEDIIIIVEAIGRCKCIRKLELKKNQITDVGANAILQLLVEQQQFMASTPVDERFQHTFLAHTDLSKNNLIINLDTIQQIKTYCEVLATANVVTLLRKSHHDNLNPEPIPLSTARVMYESIVEQPFNNARLPPGATVLSFDLLQSIVLEKLVITRELVEISPSQKKLAFPVMRSSFRVDAVVQERQESVDSFVGSEFSGIVGARGRRGSPPVDIAQYVAAAYSNKASNIPPPLYHELEKHKSSSESTSSTLHLRRTGMTDEDVIILAEAIGRCKCIRKLELQRNQITDMGATAILRLLIDQHAFMSSTAVEDRLDCTFLSYVDLRKNSPSIADTTLSGIKHYTEVLATCNVISLLRKNHSESGGAEPVPISTASAIYENIVGHPFAESRSPQGATFMNYDLLESLVLEKLVNTGQLVDISPAQKKLVAASAMSTNMRYGSHTERGNATGRGGSNSGRSTPAKEVALYALSPQQSLISKSLSIDSVKSIERKDSFDKISKELPKCDIFELEKFIMSAYASRQKPLPAEMQNELSKRKYGAESKSKLRLRSSKLCDEDVTILAEAITTCKCIRKLELQDNLITEGGAGAILKLLIDQQEYIASTPVAARFDTIFVSFVDLKKNDANIQKSTLDQIKYYCEILATCNVLTLMKKNHFETGSPEPVPISTASAIYENIVGHPFAESRSPQGAAFINYDLLESLVLEKLISTGQLVDISPAQKKLLFPIKPCNIEDDNQKFESSNIEAEAPSDGSELDSNAFERKPSDDSISLSRSSSRRGSRRITSSVVEVVSDASVVIPDDHIPLSQDDEIENEKHEVSLNDAAPIDGAGALALSSVADVIPFASSEKSVDDSTQSNMLSPLRQRISSLFARSRGTSPQSSSDVFNESAFTAGEQSSVSPSHDRTDIDRPYESMCDSKLDSAYLIPHEEPMGIDRNDTKNGDDASATISDENSISTYTENYSEMAAISLGNDSSDRIVPNGGIRFSEEIDRYDYKKTNVELPDRTIRLLDHPSSFRSIELLASIKILDLSSNYLTTLNCSVVNTMHALSQLNLSNNFIKTIDGTLILKSLVCVDLSKNCLRDASALTLWNSVEELNISYNKVSDPTGLPIGLLRLDISKNNLQSPLTLRMLSLLTSLRKIEISGNPLLSSLPTWEPRLRSLMPQLEEVNGKRMRLRQKILRPDNANTPIGLISKEEQEKRDRQRYDLHKEMERSKRLAREKKEESERNMAPSNKILNSEDMEKLLDRLTIPIVHKKPREQVVITENTDHTPSLTLAVKSFLHDCDKNIQKGCSIINLLLQYCLKFEESGVFIEKEYRDDIVFSCDALQFDKLVTRGVSLQAPSKASCSNSTRRYLAFGIKQLREFSELLSEIQNILSLARVSWRRLWKAIDKFMATERGQFVNQSIFDLYEIEYKSPKPDISILDESHLFPTEYDRSVDSRITPLSKEEELLHLERIEHRLMNKAAQAMKLDADDSMIRKSPDIAGHLSSIDVINSFDVTTSDAAEHVISSQLQSELGVAYTEEIKSEIPPVLPQQRQRVFIDPMGIEFTDTVMSRLHARLAAISIENGRSPDFDMNDDFALHIPSREIGDKCGEQPGIAVRSNPSLYIAPIDTSNISALTSPAHSARLSPVATEIDINSENVRSFTDFSMNGEIDASEEASSTLLMDASRLSDHDEPLITVASIDECSALKQDAKETFSETVLLPTDLPSLSHLNNQFDVSCQNLENAALLRDEILTTPVDYVEISTEITSEKSLRLTEIIETPEAVIETVETIDIPSDVQQVFSDKVYSARRADDEHSQLQDSEETNNDDTLPDYSFHAQLESSVSNDDYSTTFLHTKDVTPLTYKVEYANFIESKMSHHPSEEDDASTGDASATPTEITGYFSVMPQPPQQTIPIDASPGDVASASLLSKSSSSILSSADPTIPTVERSTQTTTISIKERLRARMAAKKE